MSSHQLTVVVAHWSCLRGWKTDSWKWVVPTTQILRTQLYKMTNHVFARQVHHLRTPVWKKPPREEAKIVETSLNSGKGRYEGVLLFPTYGHISLSERGLYYSLVIAPFLDVQYNRSNNQVTILASFTNLSLKPSTSHTFTEDSSMN